MIGRSAALAHANPALNHKTHRGVTHVAGVAVIPGVDAADIHVQHRCVGADRCDALGEAVQAVDLALHAVALEGGHRLQALPRCGQLQQQALAREAVALKHLHQLLRLHFQRI